MITFHPNITDPLTTIRLNRRQLGYLHPNGSVTLIRRVEDDVLELLGPAVEKHTGEPYRGCCMPPEVPEGL